jgi:hypothetical protein
VVPTCARSSSLAIFTIYSSEEDEFKVIRNHPVWGYNMLVECPSSQLSDSSLEIVLNHHERDDGNGYPGGLKGDAISDMAGLCAELGIYDLEPGRCLLTRSILLPGC